MLTKLPDCLKRPLPAGLALITGLLAGCSTANLHYQPERPHHTPAGFRNASPDFVLPTLGELARWNLERWLGPDVVHDLSQVPRAEPDRAFLHANRSEDSVTWLGHATLLVQTDGLNILTDPIFSERASPLSWIGPKRLLPPALTVAELPAIDYVLISHNHYDHLDRASIAALEQAGQPIYLVPLGVERWFAEQGIPAARVKALDWWDSWQSGTTQFAFVPAQHWSKRALTDTLATLWGGWVIRRMATKTAEKSPAMPHAAPASPAATSRQPATAPGFGLFFAGDTGYSPAYANQLKEIARRYGPFDVAALPIGAYEPRWFMVQQHVNPDDAVRMHQDLGQPWSFGIHWGSFPLTSEPVHQAADDLALARARHGVSASRFVLLPQGETRRGR